MLVARQLLPAGRVFEDSDTAEDEDGHPSRASAWLRKDSEAWIAEGTTCPPTWVGPEADLVPSPRWRASTEVPVTQGASAAADATQQRPAARARRREGLDLFARAGPSEGPGAARDSRAQPLDTDGGGANGARTAEGRAAVVAAESEDEEAEEGYDEEDDEGGDIPIVRPIEGMSPRSF